jgi:hypothetical protein
MPRRRTALLALATVVPVGLLAGCGGEGGRAGTVAVGVGEVAAAAADATTSTTSSTASAASAVATTAATAVATIADAEEPEVLFVGDSLVWLQQDALTAAFTAAGVDLTLAGGSGTGLLTGQMEWLDEIATAVATDDPDVVVIEACCNYGATAEDPDHGYTLIDGSVVEPDSQTMYDLWADAAQQAVELASAGGATVLWVVAPPVPSDHPLHDRIERFNRIVRDLAETYPELVLVDWEQALTDETGALMDPIQAADGTWESLRIDNIHLSEPANAIVRERTVDAVVAALTAQG